MKFTLKEEINNKNENTVEKDQVTQDALAVKSKFDEYLATVEALEAEAQALEVKDDQSRERAATLAGGAKKLIKAIEGRVKEIIGPADSYIKSVRGVAGKFTDRLKAIAETAGKKELDYIARLEMARREAEKMAREAAERLQAEIDAEAEAKGIEPVKVDLPLSPEPKTTARTETGITSYMVTRWVGEVFDASRVPREYCSPDQKKIDEAVKNGVRNIPGVFIHEKKEIRHR